MKAIDINEVIEYVPKCERDKDQDEKTIFKVKILSAREAATLRDDLYDVMGAGRERKESIRTGSIELKALKMGLKGWVNFKDSKDNDILFDDDNIDKMVNLIPASVRSELADFIRGESELTDLE